MSKSLLSDASQILEKALKYVSISDDAIEHLKYPQASLAVSIPVRMDDGSLKVFQGYRVRYDNTRGHEQKEESDIIRMFQWTKCNH